MDIYQFIKDAPKDTGEDDHITEINVDGGSLTIYRLDDDGIVLAVTEKKQKQSRTSRVVLRPPSNRIPNGRASTVVAAICAVMNLPETDVPWQY